MSVVACSSGISLGSVAIRDPDGHRQQSADAEDDPRVRVRQRSSNWSRRLWSDENRDCDGSDKSDGFQKDYSAWSPDSILCFRWMPINCSQMVVKCPSVGFFTSFCKLMLNEVNRRRQLLKQLTSNFSRKEETVFRWWLFGSIIEKTGLRFEITAGEAKEHRVVNQRLADREKYF